MLVFGSGLGILRQGGPCFRSGRFTSYRNLVFEDHSTVLGLCNTRHSFGTSGPKAVLRVRVLLRAASTLRSSPPFASFTGGLLVLGLVLQLVSLRLIVGPFGRVWFGLAVLLMVATLAFFFGLVVLLTLALLVLQPLLCQLSPLGFTS